MLCPRQVVEDGEADVEGGDREALRARQAQAHQRVGQGERLHRLRRVEVLALRLLHEIEARAHDRNAVDGAGGEKAALQRVPQGLVEGERGPQRRVEGDAAVAEERRARGELRGRVGQGPHLRQLGREGGLLAPDARHGVDQPRLDGRPVGDDRLRPLPLEDRSREPEPLVAPRPGQGLGQVPEPAGDGLLRGRALRPAEHRGGQPRHLRERGPEEEKVDDRVLLAPGEPLADGAVALAHPGGPGGGEPLVRQSRETLRQRLAHGLDDRPGFVVRSERRGLCPAAGTGRRPRTATKPSPKRITRRPTAEVSSQPPSEIPFDLLQREVAAVADLLTTVLDHLPYVETRVPDGLRREQKECRVEEGHLMADHVHMLVSIPPKHPV